MTTQTMLPAPNLADDQILRMVCGLRPCRRGGLRIETEKLGSKAIIHNYGQGGCGVTIGYGCAVVAAELVRDAAAEGEPVGILGGGVTALTAAAQLLAAGHPVRLYADRWHAETTSNIAGALWLPTGIETGPTAAHEARFDRILRISRDRFVAIDRARFGVDQLPVYEPDYAPHYDEFFRAGTIDRPTPVDRLPLAGPPRAGRVFRTDFIHTPRFLRTLHADLAAAGAELVTARLATLDAIRALPERVLVNCLALGSRTLFADQAVYPAYGMLVHAKPQPLGYIVHDGYKYLFPREDALLLGGCFIPDRWDTEPDEALGREILTHHRRFFDARF